MTRKVKIVATIGPACQSEAMLEKMIRAGMNVARMNFSHGTHDQHAERIACIRRVTAKLGVSVGILQDLQGPKIRVGELAEPIQLSEGEVITLYVAGGTPQGNGEKKIPVDFRQLFDATAPDFAPYYAELQGREPYSPSAVLSTDKVYHRGIAPVRAA